MGVRSGSQAESIRSFLSVLEDEGSFDLDELAFLEGLAVADGHIDAEEQAALEAVLDAIPYASLSAETRAALQAFTVRLGLSQGRWERSPE